MDGEEERWKRIGEMMDEWMWLMVVSFKGRKMIWMGDTERWRRIEIGEMMDEWMWMIVLMMVVMVLW